MLDSISFTVYISVKLTFSRNTCEFVDCNLRCHRPLNGNDLQRQRKQPPIIHCHA